MHRRLNKLLIQEKGGPIGRPSESLSSSHDRLQNVKDIRKIIEEQRLEIRERHKKGGNGFEVVKEYTDLVDGLIINMYQAIIAGSNGSPPSECKRYS